MGQSGDSTDGARSMIAERSEPLMNATQLAQQNEQHQTPPPSMQSVWPLYQRSLVRLLLLSYSCLSLVGLSCLHWQAVGQYGWRLTDFPTVSPSSSEWHAVLPAVVVVLGVVFCAPAALLLFLWLQHQSGRIAEAKQLLHTQRGADVHLSAHEQLVLQLTAMYRTQHWWMPAYVLIRRLLVAVLLVTIRSSTVWVWLTVVGFIQLVLHLRQQPYERGVDNEFESLTLLSLSLQTAVLAAFPPPNAGTVSAALLTTTTALIAAPLLAIAVFVLVRAYRERGERRYRQLQIPQQDGL